MRARIRRIVTMLLAVCVLGLLPAGLPVRAAGSTGFPDVAAGTWYEDALVKIITYTPGIINGVQDLDGVLRFHPDSPVRRGEFLKMSMTAAEGFTTDHSRDWVHWAGEYYTVALENNILVPDPFTGNTPMFPCTAEALDQPITRYEMSVVLTNACANMQREAPVAVTGAAANIPDYGAISAYAPYNGSSLPGSYTAAVEQAYGKGLLTGYEDGSFHGELTLSRAEAAVVIFRQLNWLGARSAPVWAGQAPSPGDSAGSNAGAWQSSPEQSFARWLQDGHLNGSAPDAEAREKLFGDSGKTYFRSSAEAAPFMETVTVPIWTIDRAGGKVASTTSLTVNRQVAEEVRAIFQRIYDDPERFPIYAYSVGGARYSDTLRHSWGCAIDINPLYNCECNFSSGSQRVTCGNGWWPQGADGGVWAGRSAAAYHGSLTQASPYSIAPGGSVVRAFAAYGWGWGGSGSNDPDASGTGWSGGRSFDFMHFSVLPSGG